MKHPTALIILDGFGWSTHTAHNAIAQADTPTLDFLMAHYPHAFLQASGMAVGLPEGTIGNSEVGHTTIGAGRRVPQALLRIDTALETNSLMHMPLIEQTFSSLAQSGHALHLAGLLSDAGVHSTQDHVYALIKCAKQYGISRVYIHAFLDGRDVPPESAAHYLEQLQHTCEAIGIGTLATIIGRFYAMDRDNNWERTEIAYDSMVYHEKSKYATWQEALNASYHKGITDEYVIATQLDTNGIVQDGDGLLFFNFREDRMRQLASCFANPHFSEFPLKKLKLAFCMTMTDYAKENTNACVLFKALPIKETLKEVLSRAHKTIFSIAETEKYAHVSYFFSGGKEEAFAGETRMLIPSIKTKNYVDHPSMSAPEITRAVLHSLTTKPADFYLINYANADMVGHSGDFQATKKAIECIDKELGMLYKEIVEKRNGTLYITADHGKAENMFDATSDQPRTAHTASCVPFIMVTQQVKGQATLLALHELKDVAPFILKNMNLPVPEQMR